MSGDVRRVLVTGSRHWKDRAAVWRALAAQWNGAEGDIVVVHGDCPSGADRFAREWFFLEEDDSAVGAAREERHPADWKQHGKKAGMLRNQEMVDLGADVCLAFPLPDSRGTKHCMARAKAAGIPVVVHAPEVQP